MADIITVESLSPVEIDRLAKLEATIKPLADGFATVGAALAEIRDARLYRQDYATFESYCRERWGFARNYANKIITASEVVANLGTIVPTTPATESQARPLAKLPPERQPVAWQAAQATAAAEERPVTAKDVSRAVREIVRATNPKQEESLSTKPAPVEEPKEAPAKGTAMYHASVAIAELRKIKASDTARAAAMRWVKEWVIRHA